MRIFSDTKVYIACPGNIHSGGPELLHQLGALLLQYGFDVYMFYLKQLSTFNPENPVESEYRKYCVPYVFRIDDEPQNILVLTETMSPFYFKFEHVQKILWWLSVDNYLANLSNVFSDWKNNALKKSLPSFFYFQATTQNAEHWVQSEYARQFVKLNGVHEKNIYIVEDYLNQIFLRNAEDVDLNQKMDVVVFNPAKGMKITRRLIELEINIKWYPIDGLTPAQVQWLLSKAKVYVDFGTHPGKDRIPREAAISGCVVITGKRGAAGNDIDVNIPDEFKFGETEEDFPKIIEKIRDTFQNFETAYAKQKAYREKILDDKKRFEMEVADVFNIDSQTTVKPVAIGLSYTKRNCEFAKILWKESTTMTPNFFIDDRYGKNVDYGDGDIIYENNRNYIPIDFDGNFKIPIITTDDAKFLYHEGRIKKFMFVDFDDYEFIMFIKKVNPRNEDVITLIVD